MPSPPPSRSRQSPCALFCRRPLRRRSCRRRHREFRGDDDGGRVRLDVRRRKVPPPSLADTAKIVGRGVADELSAESVVAAALTGEASCAAVAGAGASPPTPTPGAGHAVKRPHPDDARWLTSPHHYYGRESYIQSQQ